jgi:hypothetical protein
MAARKRLKTLRERPQEEQLRWLLRFIAQDLSSLSEERWQEIHNGLFNLQTKVRGWGSPPSARRRAYVLETQGHLRECFTELANGRKYSFYAPRIQWFFEPPGPRPSGARVSGRITRWNEVQVTQMHTALIFYAIDLLDAVGPDRLKACHFGTEPCGKLFIARRRQKFCSPDHARRAAWRAYLDRGGEQARKLKR